MFKIKHGHKLELQTHETMKCFGSTKNLIDKTKNGEKSTKSWSSWSSFSQM